MNLQINITPDGLLRYPMHAHRHCEIMLYLEGEGVLQTDGRPIPFEEGTIVIVPGGIRHGSVSQSGFRNISIEGAFERYFCFGSIRVLKDNEQREGASIARLIWANRFRTGEYRNALCQAYIHYLLQHLEAERYMKSHVERIADEIQRSALDARIHLAQILEASGYSQDYIRACFKKTMGMTPTEYLTEIRIRHACFLMDVYKDALTLGEIAERCGYTDYVYFSKRFRKITGLSPRQYQNA